MKFARRIFALLVLVLWWPATVHCQLATALDVLADDCAAAETHDAHHADNCVTVESGDYRSVVLDHTVAPKIVVSSDAWAVFTALIASSRCAAVDELPALDFSRPHDWSRIWQFEHRAALPARAPNLS